MNKMYFMIPFIMSHFLINVLAVLEDISGGRLFYKGRANFRTAQNLCLHYNLTLILPLDKLQNLQIFNFLRAHKYYRYWVDGFDVAKMGIYLDSLGTEISFKTWLKGQPDHHGWNEFCISVGHYGFSDWVDDACWTNTFNVICEQGLSDEIFSYEGKGTFDEAQKRCHAKHMNVVLPVDEYSNNKIYEVVRRNKWDIIWIDANDRKNKTHYVDYLNRPLLYKAFSREQPDNTGKLESCLEMGFNTTARWNDNWCDDKRHILCDKNFSEQNVIFLGVGTYKEAQYLCKEYGMKIALPKDEFNNMKVFNRAMREGWINYWIDGNDSQSQRKFRDSNGYELAYIPWELGQPKQSATKHHCIISGVNMKKLWHVADCDDINHIICMRDTSEDQLILQGEGTYHEARWACGLLGLSIALPVDDYSKNKLKAFVESQVIYDYWLDGNDQLVDGVFVDSNKIELSYTFWKSEYPKNAKKDHDCIFTSSKWNSEWINDHCKRYHFIICDNEFPKRSITYLGKGTYDEARYQCANKNMKLVLPIDDYSNYKLYRFAKRNGWVGMWIDGKDRRTANHYINSDNVPLSYKQWAVYQPSVFNSTKCIGLEDRYHGNWSAVDCHSYLHILCESDFPYQSIQFAIYDTFSNGQQFCKSRNKRIVLPIDDLSNEVLYNKALRNGVTKFWIDAKDSGGYGTFYDTFYNRINYTTWMSGRPIKSGYQESCIEIGQYSKRLWNNIDCTKKSYVLCTNL